MSKLIDGLWKEYIEKMDEYFDNERTTGDTSYIDSKDWCNCGLHSSSGKFSKADADIAESTVKENIVNLRWNLYDLSDELIELMIKKHQDYGSSNIMDAPGGAENGLAVRLHDKVARLTNLLSTDSKPNYESIRDTFVDIANYGMIGVLVLDGQWK